MEIEDITIKQIDIAKIIILYKKDIITFKEAILRIENLYE